MCHRNERESIENGHLLKCCTLLALLLLVNGHFSKAKSETQQAQRVKHNAVTHMVLFPTGVDGVRVVARMKKWHEQREQLIPFQLAMWKTMKQAHQPVDWNVM
jgi:hypothetical protein